MKSFKIALCQITPSHNKWNSVDVADEMICEAAAKGASLIVLPEMFYLPYELSNIYKKIGDEEQILERLCTTARRSGVFVCIGTMAVRQEDNVYNRSNLIDPTGQVLVSYDKCHLFDVNFKLVKAKESLIFTPGRNVAVVKTALGTIGIVVCYDIRFPEFIRNIALMGVELLLVPAVFNALTGPAHWDIMMRARAVENQFYLAAVSQGKNAQSTYQAYGHSMVVSPWGEILCEASNSQEIIYAEINADVLEETRSALPLLQHRREELYKKMLLSAK